jgi:hypothetical protein
MKTIFTSALTISVLLNVSSFAQTTVPGGEVSGTWDLLSSPYHINGDITIPDDSTLIIEPGVKVEFPGHFSLIVLGRLLAVGTETDSILFTVNDTTGFSDPDTSLGGWYGIRSIDTPVNNDSSKIVHLPGIQQGCWACVAFKCRWGHLHPAVRKGAHLQLPDQE